MANKVVSLEQSIPKEVPEISEEKLGELHARIRPLLKKDGVLYYAKESDPKKTSYTWGGKTAEKAEGIEPLATIKTIHNYGAPVFFKPSEAEVLAQIPEKYLKETAAFLIIPQRQAEHAFANGGEHHLARTVLYKKSENGRSESEAGALDKALHRIARKAMHREPANEKTRPGTEALSGMLSSMERGEWDKAYKNVAELHSSGSKFDKEIDKKITEFLLAENKIADGNSWYSHLSFIGRIYELINYAERGGVKLECTEELVEFMFKTAMRDSDGMACYSSIGLPDIECAYRMLAKAYEKKGNSAKVDELEKKAEILKETYDIWEALREARRKKS